jgi:hypothetical protein
VKKRLRHLPASLVATAALLVVGVPLGWLAGGGAGAAGVAAGAALVVFSYLVSSLVVAWVDLVNRGALLLVVLLTYVLKLTAFGVVMWHLSSTAWPGLPAMGVTIIIATILWTAAQFWWVMHAKIPYVEIDG